MAIDRIPENEKLRILNNIFNDPTCPIPKWQSQNLSREEKLSLFDTLVEEGAIKLGPRQSPIPAPPPPTHEEKTPRPMPAPLPPTREEQAPIPAPLSPTHEEDPFEDEIATKLQNLPPAKLNRLLEIKRAYPDMSIHMLPDNIKEEIFELMKDLTDVKNWRKGNGR